ncbi:ChrR family anti-sigma-E factor [Rhizobium sp. RAF56]|uniref:ChrR family anti-sigma-E factor n=1 Tax=Rhizobium sp. RAF56 TaxID=3233062 RepID=UPI003F950F62
MTTSHHIGDAFLLDFAFGNLSEGWSLAVASHLALCPSCRNRLAAMEEVGGAFLEHFEQRPVSEPGSWELMRHRLEREDRAFGSVATTEGSKIGPRVLPEPLRSYLGGDLDDLKWRALGRGAYQILIPTDDRSTQARLLRIPRGKPVPEHTHRGRELTLVLTGAFRDGHRIFRRGDVEEADDTLVHQPIALDDEDCICLAITEAPLRFTNWIVRLAQPFLKI